MLALTLVILEKYFAEHNIPDHERFAEYHKLLKRYNTKDAVELVSKLKQDYIIPYDTSDFNEAHEEIIMDALKKKLDVKLLLNPAFNEDQMDVILRGLVYNEDNKWVYPFEWYATKRGDVHKNIDVSCYADPKYSAAEMERIASSLMRVDWNSEWED